MTMTMTDNGYLSQLERDGFVVIRSILSPSELSTLQSAAAKAATQARAGSWPHIRTVGKQFPPWESTPPPAGIWGVQHLMNPDLPGHDVFTATYFSEAILSIVRELLGGCGDDELVMELFNMLVRPGEPFALRWHRDDIGADATPEQEMARLGRPAYHAQFNLALLDDDSLVVVPGSHARARTDAERAAAPLDDNMPGQMAVQLGPGDIVFYNNNILHRGVYGVDRERLTVHGSVGQARGGELRARNVLQHGVGGWAARCDFSRLQGTERARAQAMRDRLVDLGSRAGDVGFSHEG